MLLVGTGIYLTLRLGLLQIRYLPKAFSLDLYRRWGTRGYLELRSPCDSSSGYCRDGEYCRGSYSDSDRWPRCPLLDVDGCFLGMATKYAEGLLAIRYRTKDDNGHIQVVRCTTFFTGWERSGRPLAIFFAVAGVLVALFGIGTMTQVNSITGSLQASFGTAPEVASVVIALVVSTIIFGGITGFPKSLKRWFLLWLLPISLRLLRSLPCIWTNCFQL